jgi:hypothetical protein
MERIEEGKAPIGTPVPVVADPIAPGARP